MTKNLKGQSLVEPDYMGAAESLIGLRSYMGFLAQRAADEFWPPGCTGGSPERHTTSKGVDRRRFKTSRANGQRLD
jgi:hypothetical protein